MSKISRRTFLGHSVLMAGAGLLANQPLFAEEAVKGGDLRPAQILLDMVLNNPGEKPFVSHYNDPAFLKRLGYQGKAYELFDAAQFGIDWSSVDPDIFPAGSVQRAWVDQKASELDQFYTSVKSAGLAVYCHTDMIVFPKKLVEKYRLENFTKVSDPGTQKYLRAAMRQMFARFSQLDGLIVRIGETYLQGAPYHMGGMSDKTDPRKTIIPLIGMLREEVCVKLNKKVLFRAWDSFDQSIADYRAVSNGVQPHPNLMIVVKHCEGDFHRGNPFGRVLGVGQHTQIVEVECQREYEGKGAYPNYIANGVIEGFEEHHGQSIRKIWSNPLIVGMFTWSRGGGWKGPYITNELWCDMNVYVLSHWAQEPNRTEESIFNEYCSKVLMLSSEDSAKFRRLCLLSADAVYRGIRGTRNEITPWWTRDQYMGRPPLPENPADLPAFIQEKDEAVQMWHQIIGLADGIDFPVPGVQEYAKTSCRYGLHVYQIYRDGFRLAALGLRGDKTPIKALIDDYDRIWADFRKLRLEHPSCATLYEDKAFLEEPGIGAMVDEYRKVIA